jgi:hypothetical protein
VVHQQTAEKQAMKMKIVIFGDNDLNVEERG